MATDLDRRRGDRTSPLDAASELSRKELSAKPVVAPEQFLYPRLRDLVAPSEEVPESELPHGGAPATDVAEFLRKASPTAPPKSPIG